MASTLKTMKDGNGNVLKDEGGNVRYERYPITIWMGEDRNVEDQASANPVVTRPAAGALPTQEVPLPITFVLSTALKALIKAEQKAVVDVELAK